MKRLGEIYLNLFLYFYVVLFSLVAIPSLLLFVCIIGSFMSKRMAYKRFRRAISWYGAVIIRILPWPFIRIDYKDLSNQKEKAPFIFVCNHRSTFDAFLMACLPYECIQVVNIWPFKLPIWGFFARFAGYLSVRQMPFEEFSAKACKLLNEGVSIIVFPEGTRSGNKQTGNFNSAIFRVALELKCKIAPVCISGHENIPIGRSLVLKPGLIKVHKLPSVHYSEFKDFNAFKLKNYVRDLMIKELGNMDEQ